MGLDQHAHIRGKIDWDKFFSDELTEKRSFCLAKTRKTTRVHGQEMTEQNP